MVDSALVIYLSVKWGISHRRPLYEALAKELRGKASVLCVDRPICPFVNILIKPVRIAQWFENKGKPVRLGGNLYLMTPWVFFHDQLALGKPPIVGLNRRILRYQIERCLKSIYPDSTRRIAWISDPLMYDWLNLINEKLVIYECFDEYAAYPNRSQKQRQRIQFYENKLLNESDLVFVASRELEKRKGGQAQNVFFLPNAVQVEHFRKAADKETMICEDIARIKKPIIGFIGGIWGILDLKLLSYIANSFTDSSIVLIGNLSKINSRSFLSEFKKLQELKNVFWLGWKSYSLLPNYLKAMDVCLLPYVINQWTQNCHPSKMYQYLAAGKPVVSTSLPEVGPLKDMVKIAETYTDFEKGIEDSLREDSDQRKVERINIAFANSWGVRAREILEKIESRL